MIAPVCRRLRSSPYAHLRRAHSPLLLPRYCPACAAHAEARPIGTATVALGLASASPAFHNVGGVLSRLRYVPCAASGDVATRLVVPPAARKEKRFCKCFCRLFFKQLRGWGERLGVLVKARSGRNTRTSVFLVVPCNYRPTETRFRWSIVDGERLLIYSFTHNKISALCRFLTD